MTPNSDSPPTDSWRPRLRRLDRLPLERPGESLVVLRDPLELTEALAFDREFAPLLDLLDGTRTLPQLRQSLLMTKGLRLELEDLEDFCASLGENLMLEDERFAQAWARCERTFQASPERRARHGDLLYPAAADELATLLGELGDPVHRRGGHTRAVLTPHQDLRTMLPELDRALRNMPQPEELDFIVVMGGTPVPGLHPFALSDKSYETPFGPVPGAPELVRALSRRCEWCCREASRHRTGAALELSALLLRWLYGARCPPVLWVAAAQSALRDDEHFGAAERFHGALESLSEDKQVLWWCSAELGHRGPRYGRGVAAETLPADAAAEPSSAQLSGPSSSPGPSSGDPWQLEARAEAVMEALQPGQGGRLLQAAMRMSPPPSGAPALHAWVEQLPLGLKRADATLRLVDPSPEAPSGDRAAIAALRMELAPGSAS